MPEPTIDLSIVTVNWNSVDYLRECFSSIYRFTQGLTFEIIVVDNASPIRDVDDLGVQFPETRIIKSDTNLGFAGANNLGFKHSVGTYVLFLNPDTVLQSPAINQMVDHIRSLPNAGILGCKLLNTDLSVQLSSIQKFPKILNQVLDIEFLQLRWPGCPLWDISPLMSDSQHPVEVDMISGACMLMRREVFATVNMFSEDYFMYAEDIDLNYKVKKAGYTNYYVGDTRIVHHGGGSSSRQKVNQYKTIMKYRAMRLYYRKNRGSSYEVLYRAALGASAAGRLLFLGLMYLFGNVAWKRSTVSMAAEKWKIILKWALGRYESPINN